MRKEEQSVVFKMSDTTLIKEAVLETLKDIEEEGNIESHKPYMHIGPKSYTLKQLYEEVNTETEFGINFVKNMVKLALDLLHRGKRKLPKE
jgi:hypothetical protein